MTPLEVAEEMRRLSDLLDKGLHALRTGGQALAEAEEAYRRQRVIAWAQIDRDTTTAKEREDWVNGETASFRRVRDGADLDRQAALEAVRTRRTQVSALQSLLKAHAAEAEFARTGPQ